MPIFDPNAAASEDSGIFGLPFSEADASLVFIPVPWEATTSYGGGTSEGPTAILKASHQVDLYDLEVSKPYEPGLFMLPISEEVRNWNETAKRLAQDIRDRLEPNTAEKEARDLQEEQNTVNHWGNHVNQYVLNETRRLLKLGKTVGIIGGDHSVPFGALQAMAEVKSSFGILHFDAHSDTRNAYEGFQWSHASIMRNVLDKIPQVSKLVQVGIRDVCEDEISYVQNQGSRVVSFYDYSLAQKRHAGQTWNNISDEIISHLPDQVWISFDIDGLDPKFCPHTGTPVPGGLDFYEATSLIGRLVKEGKKIIGFDLNEVAPNLESVHDEWDANVGARLLYKLSAWTLASQGKVKIRE